MVQADEHAADDEQAHADAHRSELGPAGRSLGFGVGGWWWRWVVHGTIGQLDRDVGLLERDAGEARLEPSARIDQPHAMDAEQERRARIARHGLVDHDLALITVDRDRGAALRLEQLAALLVELADLGSETGDGQRHTASAADREVHRHARRVGVAVGQVGPDEREAGVGEPLGQLGVTGDLGRVLDRLDEGLSQHNDRIRGR